jgi:hypothetical protein
MEPQSTIFPNDMNEFFDLGLYLFRYACTEVELIVDKKLESSRPVSTPMDSDSSPVQ